MTTLDEINADEAAAAEAELNEPNGPMVLNADDMRLVIPKERKEDPFRFDSINAKGKNDERKENRTNVIHR